MEDITQQKKEWKLGTITRLKAEIAAEQNADKWIFGVRNTKSSIHSDQLNNIFKIFRRGNTHNKEGTGVGLSICKKIIDRHNGNIYAESDRDSVHIKFTFESV